MAYKVTIKEMPEDLRPRERMIKQGSGALSNAELLAILLRTGTKGQSALDMASQLLGHSKGLAFMAEAQLEDLAAYHGIGVAKACQIKAAVELGRRLSAASGGNKIQISSPRDAANILMDEMRYLDREHFRVINLNTKNHLLAVEEVSIGSLSASIVHPREVFKAAIRHSAAGIILAHNHPSGDPAPSGEDIDVTARLVKAGELLGIEVLDHLIFGQGEFVSLKERGVI